MIPNMQEGKCFYIEKTRLTFDKAIENGQEKLKNYGGGILYEPYNITQQKKVVDMALEHGLRGWLRRDQNPSLPPQPPLFQYQQIEVKPRKDRVGDVSLL